MNSKLKTTIETNLKTLVSAVTSHYDDQIRTLQETITEHSNRIDQLEVDLQSSRETIQHITSDYSRLDKEYGELKEEFENYQKVSIVKNLNQQISERDNEIYFLKKQIENQPSDLDPQGEDGADPYDAETDVDGGDGGEDVMDGALVEEEAVASEDVEDEEEEIDGTEEEVELSFLEMKLKPPSGKRRKAYYVTDDENMEIYEKLSGGDIGEHPIGKLVGKDKTPHFY